MSGTSVDGIDAVALDFAYTPPKLIASASLAFADGLYQQIQTLISQANHSFASIATVENALGEHYARAVEKLLRAADLDKSEICAIGNHGQTVFHHIGSDLQCSVQLGNHHLLAELTGIAVIGDFRRRDIAAGGQGAPLVAGFHGDFFGAEDEARVVLNIGGIANITWLQGKKVCCAFDCGAGNTLLDAVCRRDFACAYDQNGARSASGTVDELLLARLLDHPYHCAPVPKSTGRELFNLDYLDAVLAQLGHGVVPLDLLATLCEYSARGILLALLQAQALFPAQKLKLIACGGGVHNADLWARLGRLLADFAVPVQLQSSAAYNLAPHLVEASAFAWLAARFEGNTANNCPAATGASGARRLGAYYPA